MEIVEREGGWSGFDTDIQNSFLPTAEITTRVTVKTGAHLPTAEELNLPNEMVMFPFFV